MPSNYTTPINTSIAAQTKIGEFSASSFIDADDSDYYLNPSGNSVVSGTITADRPTEAYQLATKGYIDEKIAELAGTLPLLNGVHSQSDCTTAGGTVVDGTTGTKQCKFVASSCPAEWTANENWTTTTACNAQVYYQSWDCPSPTHSFSNKAPEWGRTVIDRTILTNCSGAVHGSCYDSEVGYIGTYGYIPTESFACGPTWTCYSNISEI